MTKSNYTASVNKESVYELMAEHAKVSMEANAIAFERLFESDEADPEVRLDSAKRELDLSMKAASLAFKIADTFMTPEFVAGFQDYLMASLTGQEDA